VISSRSNLLSSVGDKSAMLSSFNCEVVESDDPDMNPFLMPFDDVLEPFLAEQSKIETEVKLSQLLQHNDTFSTEDRWPI